MKSLAGFVVAIVFAFVLVYGCNGHPAKAADTYNGVPVVTSNAVAGQQVQDLANTNPAARAASPFRLTQFGVGVGVSPFGFRRGAFADVRARERAGLFGARERIRLRERGGFGAVNVNVFQNRGACAAARVPAFRSRRVVTEEEVIEE